jgi:hypothetical protein
MDDTGRETRRDTTMGRTIARLVTGLVDFLALALVDPIGLALDGLLFPEDEPTPAARKARRRRTR